MEIVNAIAKVRFNSARPKRVQLHKSAKFACALLCLEPGQELTATGRRAYYLIAGNGQMKAGKDAQAANLGHFVSCREGETHTIVNSSEQRLICLALS